MTNDKVKSMLNEQINKELYSAYLYLAMSDYYTDKNLDGFANWFHVQAQEEMSHAMLFRQYLQNEGSAVVLTAVAQPTAAYTELDQPLAASLAHEELVTASIDAIYTEALAGKDYKTTQFLDWFIKEQGEEEKNATDLCKKFELFGSDAKGLYMLNAELLTRVFTAPSLVL